MPPTSYQLSDCIIRPRAAGLFVITRKGKGRQEMITGFTVLSDAMQMEAAKFAGGPSGWGSASHLGTAVTASVLRWNATVTVVNALGTVQEPSPVRF